MRAAGSGSERGLVAHADERALALDAGRRVVDHEQQRLLHASGVAPARGRRVRVAERGQDARARGIGAAGALQGLDRGVHVAAAALRLGEEEQQLRVGAATVEPFLEHRARAAEVALVEIRAREHQKGGEVVRAVAQRLRERRARLVELAEPGEAEPLLLAQVLTTLATRDALRAPARHCGAARADERREERHARADEERGEQDERQRSLPFVRAREVHRHRFGVQVQEIADPDQGGDDRGEENGQSEHARSFPLRPRRSRC
jgi:hypothetical protein